VTNPEFSAGLTLDEAPLFTLGDINRGKWPVTLNLDNGTVFSYIMNNYDGDDERPFQGGVFTFHYALTSGAQFDPSNLARLGREATNPFGVQKVTTADKAGTPLEPLDVVENGFATVDPAEILLTEWKGAEDGDGYILRFYNTTERPVTGSVRFPRFQFEKVYRTNAVEVNREALRATQGQIALSLGPHENYSVRIVGFRLR
jgi:alpha-mannosidase